MAEPQTTGSALLDTVADWLGSYIRTANTGDLHILTLWAVHTHLVGETYTSPRLLLDSPAPGAGKTTTLDHLQRLCFHPVQAASLSSPSLLTRLLQNEPRTILIDEADRTLNPKHDGVGELLAVLNSGYRRGASRPVLVPDKDNGWTEQEMSTFGPVAMAGNSPELPDDTRSRCIRVLLLPDYEGTVEDSDWQYIEDDAVLLREQIEAWADEVRETVRTDRPEFPKGLKGRNRERWAPLYRVALAAGGAWPEHCRELIAAELADMEADREEGLTRVPRHVQLLRDIAAVWPEGEGFFRTRDLLDAVKRRNPAMWGEMSGFGSLTPQGLGRVLVNKFGIRAGRHSIERAHRVRGYFLDDFDPAMSSFGIRLSGSEGGREKPAKPAEPAEPARNTPHLDGREKPDELDEPDELDGNTPNPPGSEGRDGSPTPLKQPESELEPETRLVLDSLSEDHELSFSVVKGSLPKGILEDLAGGSRSTEDQEEALCERLQQLEERGLVEREGEKFFKSRTVTSAAAHPNVAGSAGSDGSDGSPTPPKQPANNIHYGILDYDDLENFPERENTP